MRKLIVRLSALAALAVAMLALHPTAYAQGVTTAGITGLVTDKNGAPIGGATVTVLHEPSGTKATTVTRPNGQYDLSGLRVGGPYTVTVDAKGLQQGVQNGVFLSLDQVQAVNVSLSSETLKLEAFAVTASNDTTFDSGKMSTGESFNAAEVAIIPTVRRDVQDIVNLDPRVGMVENTSTGEFGISVMGQNSRFNSFLIDGMQSNDPFGLNANGFSSLRSPIPLGAIAAFNVELNPYDVTRTGFTGALINVVTKSGTNELHGSLYTYYTGSSLRAKNPVTGVADTLQEHTFGFSVGGPIIKDKLFYYVSYEDWKRSAAAPGQTFLPNAAVAQQIADAAQAYGYDVGSLSSGTAKSEQKTFLAKIDWNINDIHRATLTYRRTDGISPNFADFNGSNYTSFSNHWYEQVRVADNFSAVINSNWTPNFRTEAGAAFVKYNGTAQPNGDPFPEVYINGVAGTNLNTGAPLTGQVDIGTNYSYQLNALFTKNYNGHLYGEYSMGDHTLKFGGDSDKTQYLDQFVQYYDGRYAFASPAAFAAGNANYLRYQQPSPGFTIPDSYAKYALTDYGLLLQDTWKPNERLTITGGLRYDYPFLPGRPPYLAAFQTAFGVRNNSNITGNANVEPRIGFTYKMPTKNKFQLRGGIGLFQGSTLAVWIANAFDTAGALNSVIKGSATTSTTAPTVATFNPDPNYVQTLPPPGAPTPSVDLIDPGFKNPTSWKGNFAADYELPWENIVATAEGSWLMVNNGIYLQDINLKPDSINPDGRIHYSSTALHTNFSKFGVYDLENTKKGGSQAYTLSLHRPMKNHWSFSLGYTRTYAKEVQPLTSSVASSSYNARAIFNANEETTRNSSYLVPDKFVATLTREFNFFKGTNAPTQIALVYRAQTGHAYSYVFSNDVNNDGTTGNDSFYVPSGPDDPKVVWANATQKTNFFNWFDTSDLKKYAGQVAPPNSSFNPWTQTLDVHLEQEIPIGHHMKMALFADCLNFANLLNKNWGVVTGMDFANGASAYSRRVASATVNSTGQYVYTYTAVDSVINFTDLSRWQLQLGARIDF
jgi:hypothetical protein